ncbi:hypothetical protein PGTUg99_005728 [Puccinia graminis f. sp. tritici]|uniref:Uncharacterized protein n=1 Tax=Puccinia graminis f. sp. tritici TaxID=56615 RepID=A0A5B0RGS8_PUCGR|nr:hypothetical protein PGTUg99_005728 [Puccinia graminis f. sp. tritici]
MVTLAPVKFKIPCVTTCGWIRPPKIQPAKAEKADHPVVCTPPGAKALQDACTTVGQPKGAGPIDMDSAGMHNSQRGGLIAGPEDPPQPRQCWDCTHYKSPGLQQSSPPTPAPLKFANMKGPAPISPWNRDLPLINNTRWALSMEDSFIGTPMWFNCSKWCFPTPLLLKIMNRAKALGLTHTVQDTAIYRGSSSGPTGYQLSPVY